VLLIKVVLEGKFSAVESSFAGVVSSFLDQHASRDTSSFLWKEEDEMSESRSTSSVLTLKATGCSPHIYK